MNSFSGVATSERTGKEFKVEGEWDSSPRGWSGGLTNVADGPPLPTGHYSLRMSPTEKVQIRIASMVKMRGSNRQLVSAKRQGEWCLTCDFIPAKIKLAFGFFRSTRNQCTRATNLEASMNGEWILATFKSPPADDKPHVILPGNEIAAAITDEMKLRWPG